MVQVTIYLDDEIEKKMVDAAKSANLSTSKWVAALIKAKVANDWPDSARQLAGAWQDFPSAEEIRTTIGNDADRAER